VPRAISASRLPSDGVQQRQRLAAGAGAPAAADEDLGGVENTLCFNTRVNFKPGHVEYAALYEHTDSRNRTYTVMVPYVCRNVSVLGQRGEREIPGTEIAEPASWSLVLAGLGLALGISGLLRQRHAKTRRP
jgi:hypothetical protein